jgi:penicillin-binding protein 2
MVVPHVINPTDVPSGYVEAQHFTEVKNVTIDPNGWNAITDAMGKVLLPGGTAPSANVPGIDIAGKTGSAQIVSLATRAKFKNADDLAQNGWFVGFTPRRNPDIVVCVLFQGGEHGRLAARLATQVIKAYVDKQRRTPQKMVEKPKTGGTVDIGGLWTEPDSDGDKEKLAGGRFVLDLPKKPLAVAIAAPGMHQ